MAVHYTSNPVLNGPSLPMDEGFSIAARLRWAVLQSRRKRIIPRGRVGERRCERGVGTWGEGSAVRSEGDVIFPRAWVRRSFLRGKLEDLRLAFSEDFELRRLSDARSQRFLHGFERRIHPVNLDDDVQLLQTPFIR